MSWFDPSIGIAEHELVRDLPVSGQRLAPTLLLTESSTIGAPMGSTKRTTDYPDVPSPLGRMLHPLEELTFALPFAVSELLRDCHRVIWLTPTALSDASPEALDATSRADAPLLIHAHRSNSRIYDRPEHWPDVMVFGRADQSLLERWKAALLEDLTSPRLPEPSAVGREILGTLPRTTGIDLGISVQPRRIHVRGVLTPIEHLVRTARLAADPFGVRWRGTADDGFEEWLDQQNAAGLSRLADVYRSMHPERAESQLDPEAFRHWNDEHAESILGGSLYATGSRRSRWDVSDAPSRQFGRRITNAVHWRWNALKTKLPSIAGWQNAQSRSESIVDDVAGDRGLSHPDQIRVPAGPGPWGESPRPLTVIGCFHTESGLGHSGRVTLSAVRSLGHRPSYVDTSRLYPARADADAALEDLQFGATGDINLINANAGDMVWMRDQVFSPRLGGRYNIGLWYWETLDLPMAARQAFDLVDEVWVATRYLADVFGQYGRVPVEVIGAGAELPLPRDVDRSAFGLKNDELVFLFVFDAQSSHGRKNPELAIEAFRRAFAPGYDGVRFVLKVTNLDNVPGTAAFIRALAADTPGVMLIDGYLTQNQLHDLMAAADVYVSLHASEGLGLTLLEAMSLGTPVICTAYSGNMDFTTEENSWLVDYRLTRTADERGPYPRGSVWAAPSVESAAVAMRQAADAAVRAEKSRRAIVDARRSASLDTFATSLQRELSRLL